MTTFRQLTIAEWRQFQNVQLDFHPRLTVLTGANGSGKTALLRIMARHFGWAYPELSIPVTSKAGALVYLLAVLNRLEELRNSAVQIGSLTYNPSGLVAAINAQPTAGPTYNTDIYNPQPVEGVFVPASRPEFFYQTVENIPLRPLTAYQSYDRFLNVRRARAMSQHAGFSEVYHLKETLISWALFGYGNKVVVGDAEKRDLFTNFEQLLRVVLPASLGFQSLEVRPPEVVLHTETGEFMIDAVSGGIASLIDLAWTVYVAKAGAVDDDFVVLVDEVENHLHATLQRSVLPSLLSAFPSTQFIVSSHSPLVIGSVRDSNVYVLNYNNERRVEGQMLDFVNRAGTASEILREVLGVPVTTPIWVEETLRQISDRYSAEGVTASSFDALRSELAALGLEEFAPQTIADIAKKSREASASTEQR